MKRATLFRVAVLVGVGIEIGCVLVLFNGTPNAPLGKRLWFGGLMVLAPVYVLWMYRQTIGRKPPV